MTTQKPVLVKLDQHVYDALEEECRRTGEKRNRIINTACFLECKGREARRQTGGLSPAKVYTFSGENPHPMPLISVHLSENAAKFLDFMRRQTGLSTSSLIENAVLMMMKDYEQRPFTYL